MEVEEGLQAMIVMTVVGCRVMVFEEDGHQIVAEKNMYRVLILAEDGHHVIMMREESMVASQWRTATGCGQSIPYVNVMIGVQH